MLASRQIQTLAHTKRNLLRCGCSNKTNADESSFSESLIGVLLLEHWRLLSLAPMSGFLDKIAEDPFSVWFPFPTWLHFPQEQPLLMEKKKRAAAYWRVPKWLSVECCGPKMEEIPSEVQTFCLGAWDSVLPDDNGGETLVDRIEWV